MTAVEDSRSNDGTIPCEDVDIADGYVLPPVGRPAGWYEDPRGEHHLRYYDGTLWTLHVTHFGPSPCGGCQRR